ncbi:MAG: hypothetical protein SD837_06050 [Candidatus Electrothrix scaldis]|nr:MAG: hypothetical protein SD837_06050 [Candidatus Electrothrix sp. GW3-3]
MTQTKQTRGACVFCGRKMTGNGMVKHLSACPTRKASVDERDQQAGNNENIYHLKIQDSWLKDFWLHLEMPGFATLKDLDSYLRKIWLECCGHLSQFSIGGPRGEEIAMDTKVGDFFQPNLELTHLYDFGDSSETQIKVVAAREGKPMSEHPIYLMARNELPEVENCACGSPGAWLCTGCTENDDEFALLCTQHAKDKEHEDHNLIPIINSPRTGRCGYDGPAEAPY